MTLKNDVIVRKQDIVSNNVFCSDQINKLMMLKAMKK